MDRSFETKLYDLQAAGAALCVSPWTLRRHIKNGAIKAVRIGRRVLMTEEAVKRIAREGLPSLGSVKAEDAVKA